MTPKAKVIQIASSLVAFLCLVIGFSFVAGSEKQFKSDRDFEKAIQPMLDYIEKTKADSGTLPTNQEFEFWKQANGYLNDYPATELFTGSLPDDIDFPKEITTNNDYIVSAWRGEWMVYYVADLNRFYGTDWNFESGLKHFFQLTVFGMIILVCGFKFSKAAARESTELTSNNTPGFSNS